MFTAAYLFAWLRAFAFTQFIEVSIYTRLVPTTRLRAFAASALTHPWVWFVFPLLGRSEWVTPWFSLPMPKLAYGNWAVLAELFAWLVETCWLRRYVPWRRALAMSFVANFASLSLGLLCRALTGYP
jgi:hypothetical protein